MLEALSILEAQDILMFPVLQNLGKLYIMNERSVMNETYIPNERSVMNETYIPNERSVPL